MAAVRENRPQNTPDWNIRFPEILLDGRRIGDYMGCGTVVMEEYVFLLSLPQNFKKLCRSLFTVSFVNLIIRCVRFFLLC